MEPKGSECKVIWKVLLIASFQTQFKHQGGACPVTKLGNWTDVHANF